MSQILTHAKAAELLKKLQYQKAQMGQLSIQDEYFKQALEKLPRWTACSERMPSIGQEVIIFCNEKVMSGYSLGEDKKFYETVEEYWSPGEPTHWMPLPEAPL